MGLEYTPPLALLAKTPSLIEIDPLGSSQIIQSHIKDYLGDQEGKLKFSEVRSKTDNFIDSNQIMTTLLSQIFLQPTGCGLRLKTLPIKFIDTCMDTKISPSGDGL